MRYTAIAGICLALLGIAVASDADAAIRRMTSIPAQGLGPALEALAKDRDFQILYVTSVVSGLQTGGAVGEMTIEEAITHLLDGTGLSFRYLDQHTITVYDARTGDVADSLSTSGPGTGAAVSRPEMNKKTSARPNGDENGMQYVGESESQEDTPSSERSSVIEEEEDIPEILVKGSRSLNTDIRRTESNVQPYVVFDKEQIERSMATTLEDFLKTRLPMNTVQHTNSQGTDAFNSAGNRSQINLRGLGTDETLVLIDGRRAPGVSLIASEGGFDQPDINGIPLNAIERIEVLPATAGAIYGGSATGGVVNIILKRDYSGIEVGGEYGNTFESDAENVRINLNAGFTLEGGKTQLMISGSHSEADPLLTGDRNFARRGRELLRTNNPDGFTDGSLTGLPIGYTANICGAIGGFFGFSCDETVELVLDDGTELGSGRAFVPVGYGGVGTDGGAAMLGTAGQFNLALPNTVEGSQNSLINNPTIQSLQANIRREFGQHFEGYLDLSLFDNKGRTRSARVPSDIDLFADDPGNPFATDIRVSFPIPGLSFESRSDSEQRRATVGGILRLPGNWTASAEYVFGRARSYSENTAPAVVDFFFDRSFKDAIRSGALDIFRDTNDFPLDLTPYLLPSPNNFIGPFDTEQRDVSLKIAGRAWQLPAGPIAITSLIERRKQEALEGFEERVFGNFDPEPNFVFYPERSQVVNSYYLEMQAPLFSSANARRGVRELELQASVRHDDYETLTTAAGGYSVTERGDTNPVDPFTGEPIEIEYTTSDLSSTDYTLGVRYAPVQDLALRASYSTGFLPPSLPDFVPSQPQTFDFPLFFVPDPQRGGESVGMAGCDVNFVCVPVTYLGGGNPDLQPEESESWSAGLIFTPRWVPGLRLSIDYVVIEKVDEIALPSFEDVLGEEADGEDDLPGRVARGPNLPGDDPSWLGPVIAIDTSLINRSATKVAAFDIQTDYGWTTGRFGSFNAFALATRTTKFERQELPGDPLVDSVDFSDGPLKWRGNFGLTWDKGLWTLGWNAQYYHSYKVYSSTSVPEDQSFPGDPSTIEYLVRNQGSDTIPSQTYHDLFARYRVGKAESARGLLSGVELMIGIQNVFNESPPILATAEPTGGYSAYGDPRLRRYTLTLRKSF